jgi:leader peptidase (prepilin peptidase)/N-methyltransferase
MIEAFCSLIAVLCVLRFGAQPYALLAFGVLVILIAVALIDYVTMEIPDSLSVVIALLAVAAIWLHDDVALSSRAIGLFAVSLPMLLLALVINGAFGGGDIKLMAAAGLFLGWQCVLLAFFIAALFGGGYSIFLLFSGRAKRGTRIAFGPYLCLGLAVSVFYGARIIEWYVSLLRF